MVSHRVVLFLLLLRSIQVYLLRIKETGFKNKGGNRLTSTIITNIIYSNTLEQHDTWLINILNVKS